MSGYQHLLPDARITYQEVSNINESAENNAFVSPKDPRFKNIPTIYNINTTGREGNVPWGGAAKGYYRAGYRYGPTSKGFASLRYYGNGVY